MHVYVFVCMYMYTVNSQWIGQEDIHRQRWACDCDWIALQCQESISMLKCMCLFPCDRKYMVAEGMGGNGDHVRAPNHVFPMAWKKTHAFEPAQTTGTNSILVTRQALYVLYIRTLHRTYIETTMLYVLHNTIYCIGYWVYVLCILCMLHNVTCTRDATGLDFWRPVQPIQNLMSPEPMNRFIFWPCPAPARSQFTEPTSP